MSEEFESRASPIPNPPVPSTSAPSASGHERDRRHRRVSVHVPVRVSTIDPETDPRTGRPYFRDTREYVANLSRGGAFIETDDPPSPGHRVLVQIHVPEAEPIETVGRVAWSRKVLTRETGDEGAGAGVEFLAEESLLERIGRAAGPARRGVARELKTGCPGQDSNLHGRWPDDFKSSASTRFATRASDAAENPGPWALDAFRGDLDAFA